MIAFYFTGIVDFQDMTSTLFETIRRGHKVWICIFDCLYKKRQFYYYSREELVNFVIDTLRRNGLQVPEIDYFGQDDQLKFEKVFEKKRPSLAFMQGVWHKYPTWIPRVPDKVVHFTWSYDTIHTYHKSPYKNNIILNVARYKIDEEFLKNHGVKNCRYFGNFRLSQLKYKSNSFANNMTSNILNKKVCFIPERWFRKEENETELISKIQNILIFLKNQGYTIVWKRREKGHPFNESHTILYKLSKEAKPQIVIERDLYFPSAMMSFFEKSNLVLLLGITTSFVDSAYIKNCDNVIVYNSDPSHMYNKFALDTLKIEGAGDVTIITGSVENIKREVLKIKDKNTTNKDFKKCDEINADINLLNYLESNSIM